MNTTDDELPGMMALAKGVAEQLWPHTIDASIWAAEFVKLNPGADEGNMIGWFANAIMAGYDTAQHRASVPSEIVQTPSAEDALARWYKAASPYATPEALQEALQAAKRDNEDARRFRWLKANHLQTGADAWIRTGDDLEEAIDAARKEGQ